MSDSSPIFIARRLCAFALFCAFTSFMQQVEPLFGGCGLYPYGSAFSVIVRIYCLICAAVSFMTFLNAGPVKGVPVAVSVLGVAFLVLQLVSPQAITDGLLLMSADRLLIELCILLHPQIYSHIGIKLFVFRYMFGAVCGQLVNCGGNWDDWQGIK